MTIMKNAIKCRICGSYIRMNTGYDYIPCACGAIAVDGGDQYVRILGNRDDYEIVAIPVCKEENND